MVERTTSISKSVAFETAACDYCGEEVFTDDEQQNIEKLPEGVNLVIGGGAHIATEQSSRSARSRKYRVPKVVTRWFSGPSNELSMSTGFLCPSCAEALYGYTPHS